METGMVFVLALCYINVFCEVGNCHYWGWHELFVQFHEYYSCEISLNVNFNRTYIENVQQSARVEYISTTCMFWFFTVHVLAISKLKCRIEFIFMRIKILKIYSSPPPPPSPFYILNKDTLNSYKL